MNNGHLQVNRTQVPMNGASLAAHYVVAGEGPSILFLHGLGDSAYTWQWVMRSLSHRYRVYAVSFPGFGDSAKPDASYTPDFFVDFTLAFMDALNIERPMLVGNSLGGLIAVLMVLRQPDRARALTLISSAGLGREISLALRMLTLPGFGRLLAAWYQTPIGAYQWALFTTWLLFAQPHEAPRAWTSGLRQMAHMPGYLEATVASVRSGSTILGQRNRWIVLDQLNQLALPTLVLWGERDRVVPLHHGRAAASRLPAGRLEVFRNCGHLPHIEAAKSFVYAVDDFYRQHAHG